MHDFYLVNNIVVENLTQQLHRSENYNVQYSHSLKQIIPIECCISFFVYM